MEPKRISWEGSSYHSPQKVKPTRDPGMSSTREEGDHDVIKYIKQSIRKTQSTEELLASPSEINTRTTSLRSCSILDSDSASITPRTDESAKPRLISLRLSLVDRRFAEKRNELVQLAAGKNPSWTKIGSCQQDIELDCLSLRQTWGSSGPDVDREEWIEGTAEQQARSRRRVDVALDEASGQLYPDYKPIPLRWPFQAILIAMIAGMIAFLEYEVNKLPPPNYRALGLLNNQHIATTATSSLHSSQGQVQLSSQPRTRNGIPNMTATTKTTASGTVQELATTMSVQLINIKIPLPSPSPEPSPEPRPPPNSYPAPPRSVSTYCGWGSPDPPGPSAIKAGDKLASTTVHISGSPVLAITPLSAQGGFFTKNITPSHTTYYPYTAPSHEPGPIPPGAVAAFFNLRSEGDFLMASLVPVLLATLISIPVQMLASGVSHVLPFRALAQFRSVRFLHLFSDPLPLLSVLLSVFVTVLVPLSSEVIRLEYSKVDCIHDTSICAIGIRKATVPMRVAEGFLIAMMLVLVATCVLLLRWRSGLAADPWSMASMAGMLSTSVKLRLLLREMKPCVDGEKLRDRQIIEALKGRQFRLGFSHFLEDNGRQELCYGIEVQPRGKNEDRDPIRTTTRDPPEPKPTSVRLRTSENGVSHTDGSIELCLRVLAFILIIGLVVLILYYENTVRLNSRFEAFMDSQTFGVRILFTAFGTALKGFWDCFFAHASDYQLHHHLATRPQSARNSILISPPADVFVGLWRSALYTKDFLFLNIAFASLLSKFAPILLSNVPFRNTVTWKMHETCTWMAIAVLIYMILVLAASFALWRKKPYMPAKPDTIAGCYRRPMPPGPTPTGQRHNRTLPTLPTPKPVWLVFTECVIAVCRRVTKWLLWAIKTVFEVMMLALFILFLLILGWAVFYSVFCALPAASTPFLGITCPSTPEPVSDTPAAPMPPPLPFRDILSEGLSHGLKFAELQASGLAGLPPALKSLNRVADKILDDSVAGGLEPESDQTLAVLKRHRDANDNAISCVENVLVPLDASVKAIITLSYGALKQLRLVDQRRQHAPLFAQFLHDFVAAGRGLPTRVEIMEGETQQIFVGLVDGVQMVVDDILHKVAENCGTTLPALKALPEQQPVRNGTLGALQDKNSGGKLDLSRLKDKPYWQSIRRLNQRDAVEESKDPAESAVELFKQAEQACAEVVKATESTMQQIRKDLARFRNRLYLVRIPIEDTGAADKPAPLQQYSEALENKVRILEESNRLPRR
ncbi:hypothetical protein B0H63DRAFT_546347 [Podospora didyma]|uniref:Uncharacterized protein n=1 Tax=Podospora didyma TaxID=330526 RepID=A0AAE0NHT0_9PEZI|nr:hypothetical protein B0H63DRAFT_546347 [Podospora didyma]